MELRKILQTPIMLSGQPTFQLHWNLSTKETCFHCVKHTCSCLTQFSRATGPHWISKCLQWRNPKNLVSSFVFPQVTQAYQLNIPLGMSMKLWLPAIRRFQTQKEKRKKKRVWTILWTWLIIMSRSWSNGVHTRSSNYPSDIETYIGECCFNYFIQ